MEFIPIKLELQLRWVVMRSINFDNEIIFLYFDVYFNNKQTFTL